MATKNSINIYIDGVSYTPYLVLPVKFGNFLDDRLDECNISLRGLKKEDFSPLMPVELQIDNSFYFRNSVEQQQTQIKYFLVANDTATEMQIGTNKYNHELYLVEVTKIAECFVVDTITFTNNLGRTYTQDAANAEPVWE